MSTTTRRVERITLAEKKEYAVEKFRQILDFADQQNYTGDVTINLTFLTGGIRSSETKWGVRDIFKFDRSGNSIFPWSVEEG